MSSVKLGGIEGGEGVREQGVGMVQGVVFGLEQKQGPVGIEVHRWFRGLGGGWNGNGGRDCWWWKARKERQVVSGN